MGRIKLLDEVLSNQIAAGEVVERPSSVVKELVENALDAGATQITVEINNGGSEKIRIVDNGKGMGREDLSLCTARHATSKLSAMGDLDTLQTLGFRGEALPSIASVSKMSIRTREQGAMGALRLMIHGGQHADIIEAPGPVGTEIIVSDLFFNVPARRKFLKKTATEASHVHEWVQRIALCYPQVALRFVRDGKTLADYGPADDLRQRISSVFGSKVAADITAVMVPGEMGLNGFIGGGDSARGTTRHYHIFINGRYVRDRVIMSAIQSGYGVSLPKGRHPFVVLRLNLPSILVDVNVHPAKTEVRFSDSRSVHRLVARAIDGALRATTRDQYIETQTRPTTEGLRPEIGRPAAGPLPSEGQPPAENTTRSGSGLDAHRNRIVAAMERIAVQRAGQTLERSPRTPGVRPSRQPAAQTSMMDGGLLDTRSGGIKAPVSPRLKPAPASPASAEKAPERFVGIVGEIALYLSSDTLLLVDRQRAATLITYHRLLARSGGTPLPRPLSIKLNAKQRESLSARSETLSRLGFELNAFGEGSHLLARAPEALSGESAIQWLGDYLSGADGDSQGPAEWTMAQTQSAETWETVNAKALYEATLLVVPEGEKDICTRLPQSRLKELCP